MILMVISRGKEDEVNELSEMEIHSESGSDSNPDWTIVQKRIFVYVNIRRSRATTLARLVPHSSLNHDPLHHIQDRIPDEEDQTYHQE
jgi:hypothetical protein